MCCRYYTGGGSCIIGDSLGLLVTLKPRARLAVVPAGPTSVFSDGTLKTLTARFRVTSFQASGDIVLVGAGGSTPPVAWQCRSVPGKTQLLFVEAQQLQAACQVLCSVGVC
jgi:hypothetical protein